MPCNVDGVGLAHVRHRDCLERMRAATAAALDGMSSGDPDECVVVELRSALAALSELLGEAWEDEILDRVFAQFCIGK